MFVKWKSITIYGVLLFLTLIYLYRENSTSGAYVDSGFAKQYPSKETLNSLSLTEEQCDAAFPGLNKQIDDAAARGPFHLSKGLDTAHGSVEGRIKNGRKLYIISAEQDNVLRRIRAILHSLHRAIITSPTQVPDTVFSININDEPRANTWSFARSDDHFTPPNVWLMPHFSSWSWPVEYVGPLDEALSKIDEIEAHTTWHEKIDKAVWRGTAWFDPDWDMGLRPKLVKATEGKEWADVQLWGQGQEGKNNTLAIEDFCRNKYIIYAEGKTYSGRLPYHQACASIILTPPPTFLLHTTHLIRPLFSSLLPLSPIHPSSPHPAFPTPPSPTSYPIPSTNITWPLSYPPSLANAVFVHPDWSDLEAVIGYLEANPATAQGIAERQRETMVARGYLSQAAEVCYWRRLIRSWSETASWEESEWEDGMRWETFSLLGKTTYEV
ncbi:hypothetical protein D0Z07_2927 [Hyphodiscus hymeniophilus]|uniref:Glycosyl transferase CAP10 domain-containing protein n=1 Tax=Hyphodiscus hymeniophilus TaxID=353542 RepID=A0A9P6VMT3_9HELO|nr:hypothetical protein D0Z07_2927 [Hyphodiscus hymeniophilus]